MRALSGYLLLLFVAMTTAAAQQSPASLPPSEELKTVTAPFDAARAQPNDLTDADLLALSVGVSRAGHACGTLLPSLEALTKQPEEVLALARLCIFGQQFEPARAAVVRYLELPVMPQREMALLLLTEAFLGLKDDFNAAQQVFALKRDFPYDTQIYFAADQVILAGALLNDEQNTYTLQLCGDQLKVSLPLLESGKSLISKEGTASPSTLFADAVRCVDIARDLHDLSEQSTLGRLEKIVDLPFWQGTAELAPMQSALARTELTGKQTPLALLSGRLLRAGGPLLPHTVPLTRGTALLVPFVMWAPSTSSIIRDFPVIAPQQIVYLLTSWAANTGGEDTETPELLASLRAFAAGLPVHVEVLVVPDAVLRQFHADVYPGSIVVRDGFLRADLPLTGGAAQRMTVLALGPIAPAPDHHGAGRK